jgi:hypothetical protein
VLRSALRHILLMFFGVQEPAVLPFLFASTGARVISANLRAGTHLARGRSHGHIQSKASVGGRSALCAARAVRSGTALLGKFKDVIEYPSVKVSPETLE